jgi:proteic killer suppression protein
MFDNKKLEKTINDARSLQKAYGQIGAKFIRKRLDDLTAARTMEDVRLLPGKYHELKEDRKGQISVHVHEPYRLIFEPVCDPLPISEEGVLDWKQITCVKIIEIINYHGK